MYSTYSAATTRRDDAADARRSILRRSLEREVWGYAPGTRTRTVLSKIHRLRAKIEPDAHAPAHLPSDRVRGYRLVS